MNADELRNSHKNPTNEKLQSFIDDFVIPAIKQKANAGKPSAVVNVNDLKGDERETLVNMLQNQIQGAQVHLDEGMFTTKVKICWEANCPKKGSFWGCKMFCTNEI